MAPSHAYIVIYQSNNRIIDTARYRLEYGGEAAAIEPKVFDLLVYLIENRDRVVTRNEFLEALWEGQIVSDSALSARLKGARKAVGDDGKTQNIIKTVHGRGYQFIGAVTELNPEQSDSPAEITPNKESLSLPDVPSIAVLPFCNLSGDQAQEYFSDGLTGDIITQLSRYRDIFVIASHSSFAYKDKQVKVQEVSADLGVRYILEGSVQKSNQRVRISVQLIDGTSGQSLWAERYDEKLDDIFAVQDKLTDIIVGSLASVYGGRLRKAWQAQEKAKRPQNYLAFDYFMKAVDSVDKFTQQDNEQGRTYLVKATELDPDYAKAYGKLAWTHMLEYTEGWGNDCETSMETGKALATKAIEFDDNETWGHWALAAWYMYARDYDVAVDKFNKVMEVNPNDADALADYGYYLSYLGRAKEGLKFVRKALRLNPHYPDWYSAGRVQVLYEAREYKNAIKHFKGIEGGEWIVARLDVAASYAALGNKQEAKEMIKRIMQLDPGSSLKKWTDIKRAPYKNAKDLENFSANLRKAGLPE